MSSAPSGMVIEGPAGRLYWTLHVLGCHKPFSFFYRSKLTFSLESEQKSSNTFKSVVCVPHLWAGRQITNGRMLSPEATEKNSFLLSQPVCRAQNNASFQDKFNHTYFLFQPEVSVVVKSCASTSLLGGNRLCPSPVPSPGQCRLQPFATSAAR